METIDTGEETSGFAIASVVLGIFWIFGLASIAAIWLGWRALRDIEASSELGGRGIAIAGIVIGAVGIASAGLLIAFLVASGH